MGLLMTLMVAAGTVMAPQAYAEEGGASRERNGALMDGPRGAQAPTAGAAPALAATATPVPRAEYERYWYQILAVDAASLALAVSAVAAGAPEEGGPVVDGLGSAALFGYLMGSPGVHAVHHDNVSLSALSLLLRGGLPLAGLYVGGRSARCQPSDLPFDPCGLSEAFIGSMVGAGAALIIDYTLLARKRIERAPARGLSVVPNMSASRDAFALGLSGRF